MKKTLVSMFAVTAITMAGANAAVTQEQCAKSEKTLWVSGVVNSDGTKGACVPKNACDSQSFKNQFCNTVFGDIKLSSPEQAIMVGKRYVKNNLGWHPDSGIIVDEMKGYVGIVGPQTSSYMVLDFDSIKEKASLDTQKDFFAAACRADGGTLTEERALNQMICDAPKTDMVYYIDEGRVQKECRGTGFCSLNNKEIDEFINDFNQELHSDNFSDTFKPRYKKVML